MSENHNFYFHIPFCASKCKYCDFYSHADIKPNWEKYCNQILNELDFWYKKLGKIDMPTIFFGGGTPSMMPTDIFKRIMDNLGDKFNLTPDCEITIEANPGTLDKEKLTEFKKLGLNRLSVGVQSLNDADLKFLGRMHTAKQATDLITSSQDLDLNVSADFIYGLPGQNENDIKKMCEQINSLNLNHVSLYELTIEPDTPFGKMNLDMPDNETMAKMYKIIDKNLVLPRYEVSNYARPGFECKHNLNIWNGKAYVGIGRGAAGRILIDGQWFEQTGGDIKLNPIDNKTRATEKIIMGLRTINGVGLTDDVSAQINWDFVNKNSDLIKKQQNKLIATEKGLLILDSLLLNCIL